MVHFRILSRLEAGLTKIKACPVLQYSTATGWWHIPHVTPLKSPIVVKGSPKLESADERQLTELDD